MTAFWFAINVAAVVFHLLVFGMSGLLLMNAFAAGMLLMAWLMEQR